MSTLRIFVTHSSHDATTATKIRDYLESNGIHCWMAPRDIPIGEEWAKGILNGINTASGMLLVFSSNSNDSSQVRREIERAIHNNISIYPVRIEDVQPSDAMEYYISSNHWMDAFGGNFETNLDKLVTAIKSKHNITPESEPEPASKPVHKQEHISVSSSKTNDKTAKRKSKSPKFSFRLHKKILFSVVPFLLLVIGYFILKSFESSNQIEDVVEVTSEYTIISTFNRMIASTDDFDDYAKGIRVTEDGNYVIMGYSFINEDEGNPWIAMFDSLGNEMWKHVGPATASENGAFDIFPDGRCVWAYPVIDTSLVNNIGCTLYTKEYLSNDGSVIISDTTTFVNLQDPSFGWKNNMPTFMDGFVFDISISGEFVYVFTFSVSTIIAEMDYGSKSIVYGEGIGNGVDFDTALPSSWALESIVSVFEVVDEFSFVYGIEAPTYPTNFTETASNIEIIDGQICMSTLSYHYGMIIRACRRDYLSDYEFFDMDEIHVYHFPGQGIDDVHSIRMVKNDNNDMFYILSYDNGEVHVLKVDMYGERLSSCMLNINRFDDDRRIYDTCINGVAIIHDSVYLYGKTYSLETGSNDGYLVNMSQDCDTMWDKVIDFGGQDEIIGIEGTLDGGLMLVYVSDNYGTSDVFLLKTDSLVNGAILEEEKSSFIYEDWLEGDFSQTINWRSSALTKNFGKYVTDDYNLDWAPVLGIDAGSVGLYRSPLSIDRTIVMTAQMGALGFVHTPELCFHFRRTYLSSARRRYVSNLAGVMFPAG